MQILQKGSTGDTTDSETGESGGGSSSHSVDDNRQNYSTGHSARECSPVHTKHININTNQTVINRSGIYHAALGTIYATTDIYNIHVYKGTHLSKSEGVFRNNPYPMNIKN